LCEAGTPDAIAAIIQEEFIRWFSNDIAGGQHTIYERLAQEFWIAYQRWQQQQQEKSEA
jgi:hypothetical protein